MQILCEIYDLKSDGNIDTHRISITLSRKNFLITTQVEQQIFNFYSNQQCKLAHYSNINFVTSRPFTFTDTRCKQKQSHGQTAGITHDFLLSSSYSMLQVELFSIFVFRFPTSSLLQTFSFSLTFIPFLSMVSICFNFYQFRSACCYQFVYKYKFCFYLYYLTFYLVHFCFSFCNRKMLEQSYTERCSIPFHCSMRTAFMLHFYANRIVRPFDYDFQFTRNTCHHNHLKPKQDDTNKTHCRQFRV